MVLRLVLPLGVNILLILLLLFNPCWHGNERKTMIIIILNHTTPLFPPFSSSRHPFPLHPTTNFLLPISSLTTPTLTGDLVIISPLPLGNILACAIISNTLVLPVCDMIKITMNNNNKYQISNKNNNKNNIEKNITIISPEDWSPTTTTLGK